MVVSWVTVNRLFFFYQAITMPIAKYWKYTLHKKS